MRMLTLVVVAGLLALGACNSSTSSSCCKECSSGKACGDVCIAKDKACDKSPGCACNK
jgi:hypothetical protein